MKIEALHHVVRAASGVTGCKQFLILGSQAILGLCLDKGYDFSFHESMELDIAPIPENEVATDLISGTIGELSPFHQTFGYYADGCDLGTGIFPNGWEQRTIQHIFEDDIHVFFPSAEDLALSKYCAGRGKDAAFIKKLWDEDLLDANVMETLLSKLPAEKLGAKLGYIKNRVKCDIEAHIKRGKNLEPGL